MVAACKDECTQNLSGEVLQWFDDMGSSEIWDLTYRAGFAFVGISGKRVPTEKRALHYLNSVEIK